MLKQAHLYIKGDVIGVGFRAWAKIQAKLLNVKGWVRNSFDRTDVFGKNGGVEATIQGPEDKLEEMIELLKKGPPVSRVDDVEVLYQEAQELFDAFEIRK